MLFGCRGHQITQLCGFIKFLILLWAIFFWSVYSLCVVEVKQMCGLLAETAT